ncbi:PASTA domain-containing protein [Nocardia sp. NPDC050630]|uniref:PASTA domain-containing protein n=1 Tax=Nocardia sp. NPDC050630 TaxID=3364321 RepID=UPI0037B1D619
MSYQQPPHPPYGQPPRPPIPLKKKSTPVWVWIAAVVGGLLVLGLIGSAVGGTSKDTAGTTTTQRAAPIATAAPAVTAFATATTTVAPAADLTIPNVVGKNGAVAADELKRAGFTNVTYGSATPGVEMVIMPSNWTVKSVEPGVGTAVASNSAVVLTMTKNNR